jgi:phosphate transport system permease protein
MATAPAAAPPPRPLGRKRLRPADVVFASALVFALGFGMLALVVLLWQVLQQGLGSLSWDFFTSYTSRNAEDAGIRAALLGSLWVLVLVAVIAFPIGVGASIYLEEFARKNRFARLVDINIANLAAVPSVVYGILGLAAFVRFFGMGRSVIAAALTLSLLVLPIIIVASREALRAVPRSIREGGLALGATRWQTVRAQVLPAAMPGILTGTILALSRAIGEAAPMILIGAAAFIATDPSGLGSSFTVLPIQIFNWTSLPKEEFREIAAAGIIVLIGALLVLNGAAIFLRNKFSRKW